MKRLLCVVACCLLAACASGPPIDTTYSSPFEESRVQFLVIHHTVIDFPATIRAMTTGRVSYHYVVRDDSPIVYRLVDENRTAWHAGVSSWKGHTQLNASSVGIGIVNLANEGTPRGVWMEYPKEQIDAVIALAKEIVKRHQIKPDRVVGHSDIAPQRKIDPGPKFPWKRLADEGLIIWPDPVKVQARLPKFERDLPDPEWWQGMLAKHGFAVPNNGELDVATVNVIAAFQMKYRPARFDGFPDPETAALLDVLVNP